MGAKTAVIVDPYSSGALYQSEFAKHGVPCIAVQTRLPVPVHFRDFDGSKYTEVLPPMLRTELVALLRAQNIVAVVAGCDTGVAMADDLAAELGLPGNNPSDSVIRRCKDQMQEALKRKGILHIATTVFKSLDDFSKHSNDFGDVLFVIKPINSAGSEGVRLAQGAHGVAEAMKIAAWERENVLGELNDGFVVQPFIKGREYVVDLVPTRQGFFVAAVCRVNKVEINGSRFVCESVDLLDPQDATLRDLTEYAQQAARTLGAISGPVHMELLSGSHGSVMIEANCRLPGAGLPLLYTGVYTPDLLSATVCTFLGKPIAPASASEPAAKRERFGRVICLISEAEHEFLGLDKADETSLQNLESYRGYIFYIKEGDSLKKTIDFATCPGVVLLAHENVQRLIADEETVRIIFSPYLSIT